MNTIPNNANQSVQDILPLIPWRQGQGSRPVACKEFLCPAEQDFCDAIFDMLTSAPTQKYHQFFNYAFGLGLFIIFFPNAYGMLD